MSVILLTISAALLVGLSTQNIDLGPAYSVRMTGSKDWTLVRTFTKSALFVEGFEMIDDQTFIQSVGLYWGSKIQRVSLDDEAMTSVLEEEQQLPQSNFGEGCTLFNGQIYQMTYRERRVFIFDPVTMKQMKQLQMPSKMEEGWGLTHDQTCIYASDGTNRIFKIEPSDFSVIEIIQVTDPKGKPIKYINELELVGDYIYANVLPLNIVIKIDKVTGVVDQAYDFTKLFDIQMAEVTKSWAQWDRTNNVMNGIAFREETGNLLITGKNYNFIFEVQLH